jgi:hypothetical protein
MLRFRVYGLGVSFFFSVKDLGGYVCWGLRVYDLRFFFVLFFSVKDLGGYAFWGLGFKI